MTRSQNIRSAPASTRTTRSVVSANAQPGASGRVERQGDIVKGFLYNTHYADARKVTFYASNASRKFGSRIHRLFITVDNRTFVVYGYTENWCPINSALAKLKRTTLWHGEVAVFCLGTRRPLLVSPQVPLPIINFVASLFVARATESLDLGKRLPFHIHSSFADDQL
ncbi:hypothetical protein MD484_g5228, partial [Candolleomyces efflorescens]